MIKPTRRRIQRQLLAVLGMLAASSALAGPSCAQLFEDRPWFDRPRHTPNFFSPFFDQRGSPAQTAPAPRVPYVQQLPADSKAPPPRKVETPHTAEILVIGDSLADWLAYGLEEVFADTPEIGIVRKIRPYSGLVRYEAHNDALEWPQVVKDALAAEKPKVIVVMLGVDRTVGARPDLESPATGGLEPFAAPGLGEPHDADACAKPCSGCARSRRMISTRAEVLRPIASACRRSRSGVQSA